MRACEGDVVGVEKEERIPLCPDCKVMCVFSEEYGWVCPQCGRLVVDIAELEVHESFRTSDRLEAEPQRWIPRAVRRFASLFVWRRLWTLSRVFPREALRVYERAMEEAIEEFLLAQAKMEYEVNVRFFQEQKGRELTPQEKMELWTEAWKSALDTIVRVAVWKCPKCGKRAPAVQWSEVEEDIYRCPKCGAEIPVEEVEEEERYEESLLEALFLAACIRKGLPYPKRQHPLIPKAFWVKVKKALLEGYEFIEIESPSPRRKSRATRSRVGLVFACPPLEVYVEWLVRKCRVAPSWVMEKSLEIVRRCRDKLLAYLKAGFNPWDVAMGVVWFVLSYIREKRRVTLPDETEIVWDEQVFLSPEDAMRYRRLVAGMLRARTKVEQRVREEVLRDTLMAMLQEFFLTFWPPHRCSLCGSYNVSVKTSARVVCHDCGAETYSKAHHLRLVSRNDMLRVARENAREFLAVINPSLLTWVA